ncbi:hypothetical protein NMY22_g13882 [Coprinellus aureogranulatus]|nr:hypothetical protein NMY22_g13882 [Coprinellus aureogranulatus]
MTSTTETPLKVFKVIPTTQSYDWGKRGRDAKVAAFAEASKIPGFEVQEDKPYAELWMGTHPTSPSRLASSPDTLLSSHLATHWQTLIGTSVASAFPEAKKGELPFLFKVLSIAKALSIQSHPDKAMARELHAKQPGVYKDPNHKPEMALALTEFDALCGFRPLHEIADNIRATPELASLIPSATLDAFYAAVPSSPSSTATPEQKAALKNLFEAVMSASPSSVDETTSKLISRYTSSPSPSSSPLYALEQLILTLNQSYPNDIGLFCPLLLNVLHLSPGEAIYLGAGEPHAYLKGEAIECMANSDNVIRAGLTPKLRDVGNLVRGLTYECGGGKDRAGVKPVVFGGREGEEERKKRSVVYDPPIDEFSVVKLDLPQGESELQRAVDGPSLTIITEGRGSLAWAQSEGQMKEIEVGTGDVVFIGAGTPVSFSTRGREGRLEAYRAFVEA